MRVWKTIGAWVSLLALVLASCAPIISDEPAPTPDPRLASPSGTPISVTNATAVECLARFSRAPIYGLAWSRDQRLLAIMTLGGAYLYDSVSLKEIRFIQDPVMIGMSGASFSPDGQLFAAGSREDNRAWIYHVKNGEVVQQLVGHEAEVRALAFSPDGRILATGSADNTIKLWSVSSGMLIRSLQGHMRDVLTVAFSPDGTKLASGSWDNTARVWRVSDGAQLYDLQGHEKWVRSVTFSPDGNTLATGSWDKTIRVWDLADGRLINQFKGPISQVEMLSYSPDGLLLAEADNLEKSVSLLRASDGALVRRFGGYKEPVIDARFSPDGSLLGVASSDGTVNLWGIPGPPLANRGN